MNQSVQNIYVKTVQNNSNTYNGKLNTTNRLLIT